MTQHASDEGYPPGPDPFRFFTRAEASSTAADDRENGMVPAVVYWRQGLIGERVLRCQRDASVSSRPEESADTSGWRCRSRYCPGVSPINRLKVRVKCAWS